MYIIYIETTNTKTQTTKATKEIKKNKKIGSIQNSTKEESKFPKKNENLRFYFVCDVTCK